MIQNKMIPDESLSQQVDLSQQWHLLCFDPLAATKTKTRDFKQMWKTQLPPSQMRITLTLGKGTSSWKMDFSVDICGYVSSQEGIILYVQRK